MGAAYTASAAAVERDGRAIVGGPGRPYTPFVVQLGASRMAIDPGSARELMDAETFTTRPAVRGRHHLISAVHYLGTMGGMRILQRGGNAIDAGVAAGLCLNVVQPHLAMFGGVAPIIVHPARTRTTLSSPGDVGDVAVISGLGRWPRAATLERYLAEYGGNLPVGIGRTVTPAAPDAWLTALGEYGTLSLEEALLPALSLAEEGFPIGPELHEAIARAAAPGGAFAHWPTSADVFLIDGRVPAVGEIFRQPQLARTFRRLIAAESRAGGDRRDRIYAARDLVYCGEMAREIAAFVQNQGGLLTEADLAEVRVAVEAPVRTRYRGYDVMSCGPWCQGPTLLIALNLLEAFDLRGMAHNSAVYLHHVLEALKLAFADRDAYFGDPDFVPVPMPGLLAKDYAAERRKLIREGEAWPGRPPAGHPEPLASGSATGLTDVKRIAEHGDAGRLHHDVRPMEGDTSYVCVVDAHGNAFSATPSDSVFAGPMVPGLGFAVSARGTQTWLDPAHPSCLAPWKRPRLTPNPALVGKAGQIFMPFGCPGGDTQVQGMLQMLLNVVDFGLDPQAAIEAPRAITLSLENSFWPHRSLAGRIDVESRVPEHVRADLAAWGHDVHAYYPWGGVSLVCAVAMDSATGTLVGGADPRGDCYAAGW